MTLSVLSYAVLTVFPGYFVNGHEELADFYNRISLGQSKSEIRSIFDRHQYHYLTLSGGGQRIDEFYPESGRWEIYTPSRLAQEWVAVLRFDGDTLTSTFISIVDAAHVPRGAPRPRPNREIKGWETEQTPR